MAGPRPLVAPPSFVPGQYGLLSVVQPRFDEPEAHWRNGVTWQDVCGDGDTTFDDYCVTGSGAPTKTNNIEVVTRGAMPFVVYAEIDCSTPGYSEAEQFARTMEAFTRIEPYRLERVFWTGIVAGGSGGYTMYPHLAHSVNVFDSPGSLTSVQLQTAVDQVTGVALDPVEALGRLEDALGDCVAGQAVIHVTPCIAAELAANSLIAPRNGKMMTVKGNLVAIGDGYRGTAPNGTSTDGQEWMYGTGQVFAYRSSAEQVGQSYREVVDRDGNTVATRVERTYVLGWSCCHVGVAVSRGGVISGTFNSAT